MKKTEKQVIFLIDDKLQFNICTCIKTNKQYAVNLKLVEPRKETGFITMIKDNYGFIELSRQNSNTISSQKNMTTIPRDMFFHFSSVQSHQNDLEVGDEVEFKINRKNKQKMCAENVFKLTSGTIKPASNCLIQAQIYKGKIIQPLRSHSNNANSNFNSNTNSQDQIDDAYYGKILLINEKKDNAADLNGNGKKIFYQFGMFSLNDKRNFFQNGDMITFQLIDYGNKKFAHNINYTQTSQEQQQMQQQQQQSRTRGGTTSLSSSGNSEFKRGKVDSVKGHCGHIEYAIGNNGEMKKLFFHISDVQSDGADSPLKFGDEVEFMVSHNPRNNKYSATKIKRTSIKDTNKENASTLNDTDNKRPERLITKLKLANIDKSGKQLVLIRQPNNPDLGKTKSFCRQLSMRLPGSLTPLVETTLASYNASNDLTSNTDNGNGNQARPNSMSIMDMLMGIQN